MSSRFDLPSSLRPFLSSEDLQIMIASMAIMMGGGKIDIDQDDLEVAHKAFREGRVRIIRVTDPPKIRIEVREEGT